MIEYKKVLKKDKEKLKNLINIVLKNLERKEFFIPFTEQGIDKLFCTDKTIIYGAYDGDKIVGTAMLYLSESAVSEIKEIINLKNCKVAELGGYMVLSEYRNQGIMRKLQEVLIDITKKLDIEYLVITVHPENIPSNKTVKHTGAKVVKTAYLGKYLRNIYLLKV